MRLLESRHAKEVRTAPAATGSITDRVSAPRTTRTPLTRIRARRLAVALPFVLPSFIGVMAFLIAPVVIVLILSFFQWNFLTPPHWVGFANFTTMTKDDHVFRALLVTVYYVLWNIPLQTLMALGLAILLNRRLPALGLFRALYVLPYMSTPVAMAVVWGWMFNGQSGLINHLLLTLGVHGPNWLGDATTALPTVAMMSNWQYAGYNMLFFLAGMQTIPPALHEAASIDGAGPVQRFLRITLPLLNPTMLFVLVTDVIGSFQIFDTVYVLTQGGPGSATTVINYQIYTTAFQNFDVGSAAAMSLLLFGVILVVTLVQFRFFRSRTTYEVS
ncbi:MAG TPA: sugar ABC transporter permease [Actinocrinis sp.]|jgi:multiple sugar transport system permease protein/sn-glycerol 3-phosphate transport system permease protein